MDNWTFDRETKVTDQVLAALEAAKQRPVAVKHPDLLGQAERIVFAGHVMIANGQTWVYDPAEGWAIVTAHACPHCSAVDGDPCQHILAGWLAHKIAKAESPSSPVLLSSDQGDYQPSGIPGSWRGHGHNTYTRARRRGNGKCRTGNCAGCGWFRKGTCKNPSRGR